MNKQEMITVGVMIPRRIDDVYREAANTRMVSKSALMREALMQHLDGIRETNRMVPSSAMQTR